MSFSVKGDLCIPIERLHCGTPISWFVVWSCSTNNCPNLFHVCCLRGAFYDEKQVSIRPRVSQPACWLSWADCLGIGSATTLHSVRTSCESQPFLSCGGLAPLRFTVGRFHAPCLEEFAHGTRPKHVVWTQISTKASLTTVGSACPCGQTFQSFGEAM